MTENESWFPPAPSQVAGAYGKNQAAYRLRLIFLLLGLFGFLLFYLGLLFLTGWCFLQVCWLDPIPPKDQQVNAKAQVFLAIVWLGALIALAMLFAFLLKGLFKGRRNDESRCLEIKPEDQPRLFAFIEAICRETSAPKPHKVLMSPEVNAAVVYNTSLLNLIIPPRKNLLIGAGLVEALNLREFKAVLAHEFGHFSQKSLALGNYVYVVDRILDDIIHSRDQWDEWLNRWASWDIRVSLPAWILLGVVWVLRKIMGGLYRGIHLLNFSLSRQMEFDADECAVRSAGSAAIVNALYKLEFAQNAQNFATRQLAAAADHGVHSPDPFFHQTQLAHHLRKVAKEPNLGLLPEEWDHPAKRLFPPHPEGSGPPSMWLGHPANHLREENAKRIFVSAEPDDRPAWVLFQNGDELKKKLAAIFYERFLEKDNPKEFTPPEKVQQFLEDELAEINYDPKYENIYENRWIGLDRLPDWMEEARKQPMPVEEARAILSDHPSGILKALVNDWYQVHAELKVFQGLQSGDYQMKGKTFEFRGKACRKSEIPGIVETLHKDLGEIVSKLAECDRQVFLAHHGAAGDGPPERATELVNRYHFHAQLQDLVQGCSKNKNQFLNILQFMKSNQMDQDRLQEVVQALNEIVRDISGHVKTFKEIPCPSMTHVEVGTPLARIVWEENEKIPYELADSDSIPGEWLGAVYAILEKTIGKLERVHFKSLGMILRLQESIARDWLEKNRTETVPTPTLSTVNGP